MLPAELGRLPFAFDFEKIVDSKEIANIACNNATNPSSFLPPFLSILPNYCT
jgi:hypothetical protein